MQWIWFVFSIAVFAHSSIAFAHDGPNIIFIIADDLNYDDLGCYGNKEVHTPNIDKLASQGIRFEKAYVTASSCSPSRASIITGKYPHQTGAEQLHWPLPQGTTTFVGQLKNRGYYTAAAGKWHLGDNVRNHFDVIYEASTDGFVLPEGSDGEENQKMVAQSPSGCEDWVRTVKEAQKQSKPFFLWLASLDPHREYEPGAFYPPHDPNRVFVPPYLPNTPEVRQDIAMYYDEIGRLDHYVGEVMKLLPSQNRPGFRSTIVFFFSDNGRPFPRAKTTLYEDGIRTPLIVRWPEYTTPGRVSKSLISTVDLAPTVLDITLVEPAMSVADGRPISSRRFEQAWFRPSFKKNLMDEDHDRQVGFRPYVVAEDHWHDFEDHARSITDGRFKLIRNDYPDLPNTPSADAMRSPTWRSMVEMNEQGLLTQAQRNCFQRRGEYELYDLESDPFEMINLIDKEGYEMPVRDLKKKLSSWAKMTDDYIPAKRTPDEFDRQTGEPDASVRKRPRPSKIEMFGTNSKY